MSPRHPATTIAPRAATRMHLLVLHRSAEPDLALREPTSKRRAKKPSAGSVSFRPKSENRKLSPVHQIRAAGRNPRLVAQKPFVSSTYVSIAATCPDNCAFKTGACYVMSGITGITGRKLDAAAHGLTADQVIAEEARLIDGAFHGRRIPQDGARGGRDLRLHVGGDVGSVLGARLLAGAAGRWRDRGGGAVWTFTHAWRDVPREAWGPISVLASVERPEDIQAARAVGYAAAIVVDKFPSERAFSVPGSSAKIVPCPAETRGTTCVECRLCLDADKLLERNVVIAFEAHGPMARRAREALVQQRMLVVDEVHMDRSEGR
jgi:hypothetical protein